MKNLWHPHCNTSYNRDISTRLMYKHEVHVLFAFLQSWKHVKQESLPDHTLCSFLFHLLHQQHRQRWLRRWQRKLQTWRSWQSTTCRMSRWDNKLLTASLSGRQTDISWMIWFVFHLLIIISVQLSLYIQHHFLNTECSSGWMEANPCSKVPKSCGHPFQERTGCSSIIYECIVKVSMCFWQYWNWKFVLVVL